MKIARLLLLCVPALPFSMPAEAQRSSTLEEVVVTATRREESAQDVPVALTALSGKDLEEANVVDITDIGFMAPNVQLQPEGERKKLIEVQAPVPTVSVPLTPR